MALVTSQSKASRTGRRWLAPSCWARICTQNENMGVKRGHSAWGGTQIESVCGRLLGRRSGCQRLWTKQHDDEWPHRMNSSRIMVRGMEEKRGMYHVLGSWEIGTECEIRRCSWTFKSSGMWFSVISRVVSDVSKNRSAVIFKVKRHSSRCLILMTTAPRSFETSGALYLSFETSGALYLSLEKSGTLYLSFETSGTLYLPF